VFAKDCDESKPVIICFEQKKNLSIVSDYAKVSTILKELIKNAYKYTSQGSIDIGVEQSRKGKIGIFIEDTGCGIAPEKLKMIFESFRQVDQSMSRVHGGLGIGLALSKSFANVIEAEIEVESQLDRGSKFTLWLNH
jgi:signal transduction histidine kinase